MKRVAWIVLAVSFLAVLMLAHPSQAKAAVVCPNNTENLLPPGKNECRPVCETPPVALTAATTGLGTGTFTATAKNPYDTAPYDFKGDPECAVPVDATHWNVKKLCAQTAALHCIHWHTYLGAPQGIPIPATAVLTATADAGSYFAGWSTDCVPSQKTADPRTSCAILMDAPKTATATFSTTADIAAPAKPTLTVQRTAIGTVKLSWSGASDETWLGGYEIYRNGTLYAPHPRAAANLASVTLGNQLCKTVYTWEIRAFDGAGHETASDAVQIDMGNQCPKPPPPGTQLHIWPPKVTKQRSAFFHWGPLWKSGQTATRVNYQCKIDKQKNWKKCFPGKTYRRLKPGKHIFKVRAGNSGGWDKTPATWRWTIKK